MGKIEQGVEFTGSIGNFTAYRMWGIDGIVVRKKGGVSKERIQGDPQFARTRENNAEFSGRSTASRRIMKMLRPLKPLADYNIAGPINALLRPLQLDDAKYNRGERAVELSKHPELLEGFSLNRKILFESIVQAPLSFTLSRETMSAEVVIPELMPGINFKPFGKHALYGFQAVLGMVPDLFFTPDGYQPSDEKYPYNAPVIVAASDWFPCVSGSPATRFELKYPFTPPNNQFVLMLSIGIRYGYPAKGNGVDQAKHAGAARVLKVV